MSDERRVEYVRLDDLHPNPANPKQHDLGLLSTSMGRWGIADLPVLDERTMLLVSGHGRRDTLAMLRNAGLEAPEGVVVNEQGDWLIPVVRGWASKNDREASGYLVAANESVKAGGWDESALAELLTDLASVSPAMLDGTGYDGDDLDSLITTLAEMGDWNPDGPAGERLGDTDPYAEWEGMPDYQQEAAKAAKTVVFHFPTEDDFHEFWTKVGPALGIAPEDQRQSQWWPEHDGLVGSDSETEWKVAG